MNALEPMPHRPCASAKSVQRRHFPENPEPAYSRQIDFFRSSGPKVGKRLNDHFVEAECLRARPANAPVGTPS